MITFNESFYLAVKLLLMGMSGIFVVMILIAITVFLLSAITKNMD